MISFPSMRNSSKSQIHHTPLLHYISMVERPSNVTHNFIKIEVLIDNDKTHVNTRFFSSNVSLKSFFPMQNSGFTHLRLVTNG